MQSKRIPLLLAFIAATLGWATWTYDKSKDLKLTQYKPMLRTKAYDARNFTRSKPGPAPSVSNNGPMFSPVTVQTLKVYSKENNLSWSPYMDALDEDTILSDAPFADVNDAACIENSVIYVIEKRQSYEVGDEIRIRIQLYDGHGNGRLVGGDRMQVRIFEDSVNASARGHILDHMNGTYTAVVKCLWSGQPSIEVYFDLLRPTIRMYYQFFRTHSFLKEIHVNYTNGEIKTCQPYIDWLNPSVRLCNMTDRNGGMSWFCEAPDSKSVSCNNNVMFLKEVALLVEPRTDAERQLKKRSATSNFPLITINVTEAATDDNRPPCSSYNKTKLWFLPSPYGYVYNGKWKVIHCSALSSNELAICLRGKHFVIYGDSTGLQTLHNLQKRFNCSKTVNYANSTVKPSSAINSFLCEQSDVTIDWIRHALPGNCGRNSSDAIATDLFRYQERRNVVFLIHIFAHFALLHPRAFRDRMRLIRKSIEMFLKSSKDALFLLRGGHFYNTGKTIRYANYVFRLIMIEEFSGLLDKVIYIDYVDITIATKQESMHPEDYVVQGLIDQFLAYICS